MADSIVVGPDDTVVALPGGYCLGTGLVWGGAHPSLAVCCVVQVFQSVQHPVCREGGLIGDSTVVAWDGSLHYGPLVAPSWVALGQPGWDLFYGYRWWGPVGVPDESSIAPTL